jgi:hypothetical protein
MFLLPSFDRTTTTLNHGNTNPNKERHSFSDTGDNTLFVPNLGTNLISSVRIVSKGFHVVYDNRLYTAIRRSDNKIIF